MVALEIYKEIEKIERNRDVRQLKQSKRGRRSHRGTARSDESATRELKGEITYAAVT